MTPKNYQLKIKNSVIKILKNTQLDDKISLVGVDGALLKYCISFTKTSFVTCHTSKAVKDLKTPNKH